MSDTLHELKKEYPLMNKITNLEPVIWMNPNLTRVADLKNVGFNKDDIMQANALWERFAPFLAESFPEIKNTEGIIESPLAEIPEMKKNLENTFTSTINGDLYLKCDNHLPVAGSIKARGGFF